MYSYYSKCSKRVTDSIKLFNKILIEWLVNCRGLSHIFSTKSWIKFWNIYLIMSNEAHTRGTGKLLLLMVRSCASYLPTILLRTHQLLIWKLWCLIKNVEFRWSYFCEQSMLDQNVIRFCSSFFVFISFFLCSLPFSFKDKCAIS